MRDPIKVQEVRHHQHSKRRNNTNLLHQKPVHMIKEIFQFQTLEDIMIEEIFLLKLIIKEVLTELFGK